MTATEIVTLVEALVWPVVVLVAVLLLRPALPEILRRTRKIGVYGLEVELEAADEFVPTWTPPNMGDVRQATAAGEFSSHATSLMQEFRDGRSYDYAAVDLGHGRSWLTSRLYIFSIMLHRMRGLGCWVFLRPDEGVRRVYLGFASPVDVRWALARRYAWLEAAYARAYARAAPLSIESSRGALEPWQATQVVQAFLAEIQRDHPPPPGERNEWIELSEGGPWERAVWLDTANLGSILGGAVAAPSIAGDLATPSEELLQAVLRAQGEFVALVGNGWTFNGLINRRALLDALGLAVSRQGAGSAP